MTDRRIIIQHIKDKLKPTLFLNYFINFMFILTSLYFYISDNCQPEYCFLCFESSLFLTLNFSWFIFQSLMLIYKISSLAIEDIE